MGAQKMPNPSLVLWQKSSPWKIKEIFIIGEITRGN